MRPPPGQAGIKLLPLSRGLLLGGTLETALGLAGIGAAVLVGLDGRTAGVGAGTGSAVYGFVSLVRGHRLLGHLDDAVPVSARTTYASGRIAARAAVRPSAVGLAVLAAVSLAFEPALAAVLAGVLAGGGAAKVLLGAGVSAWERIHALTLFSAPRAGRLYVASGRGRRRTT